VFNPKFSDDNPETSDGNPETSDDNPETSDGNPETSDGNPETSDGNPETSDGNPETSDDNPETSDDNPKTSETDGRNQIYNSNILNYNRLIRKENEQNMNKKINTSNFSIWVTAGNYFSCIFGKHPIYLYLCPRSSFYT
jgi:hypothetical protein